VTASARRPRRLEGPPRVLVGKERFSENHAWSEMPQHWPAGLAGRVVIEVAGPGQLEARLVGGGPPVDVVVPLWSPLPGAPPLVDDTGHLAGLGLDVFPAEPYPAGGPLATHPHIVATAHTAALTSDYFAAASRRLGDALVGYLDHQPPAGLLR
jgi:hypothetical protein